MSSEKEIMDEIYGIRERIYEKIKDMSPQEHMEYFIKSTEKIEAELGVKFKRSAQPLQTV